MTPEYVWNKIDQDSGLDEYTEFLKSGGDRYYIDPNSNWSFLHIAVALENYQLIDAIISSGFDLNFYPPCGYPAIFEALDGDIDGSIQCDEPVSFESTRYLIEKGASLNVCDDGKSLAEYAEKYGIIFREAFEAMILEMQV